MSDTMFIGKRNPMEYALEVATMLNAGQEKVFLKARGNSISRAVDVAEIVRNKLVTGAQVEDVQIGTEKLTGDDGKVKPVSHISICLVR